MQNYNERAALIIFTALLIPLLNLKPIVAQTPSGGPYRITSSVAASGGGTSSGSGNLLVEGTAGQPAAGGPYTGSALSHEAGFWPTALAQPSQGGSPTIQFSAANYMSPETLGALTVTISRTGDTSAAASVDYSTIDGAATQKGDYEIALGTVNFGPGETVKTFQVLINEDNYIEGDETFSLSLSNVSGATLGAPHVSTVTIMDDTPESPINPTDDLQSFVYMHYHDFLNREPDPPGLGGWINVLSNCTPGDINCDRIHVSGAFYESPEFQDRGYFLYRFYSVALGRKPDYLEFMFDLPRVSGFLNDAQLEAAKAQFATAFVSRPAFMAKYNGLTNTTYVDALLQTAGVSVSGEQALVNSLDNQTLTRAQVLRLIVESSEVSQKYYNQAFVVMQYFGYLRRDPDVLYLNWIKVLDSTGDSRGLVNGFVNSVEYRQRFGP